jgi:hypothetical protein
MLIHKSQLELKDNTETSSQGTGQVQILTV